jgi:hypothetical protein
VALLAEGHGRPRPRRHGDRLDPGQIELVRPADTAFVASAHPRTRCAGLMPRIAAVAPVPRGR